MMDEELTAETEEQLLIKIENYLAEYPPVYFTRVKLRPYSDNNGVWHCIMRRATSCD